MTQESSTPLEFHSETISVLMTRRPGCQVTWQVEVKPKGVEAAEARAVKEVSKKVSMPGFRKGRAPEAILRKNYASAIESEWKDLVISTSFQEAMKLTECFPFNERSIHRPKVSKMSKEEGASIEFQFESNPSIPEIELEKIHVDRPEIDKVEESDIQEQLSRLRDNHAEFEEKEGAVEEGDYVVLDIDKIEEGNASPLLRDERFKVSKETLTPWIIEDLLGKASGDSFEGTSRIDPEATDEEKERFEPQQLKIVIKKVQRQALPSDEKLLEVTRQESMDQLHEELRKHIESSREREAEDTLRFKLWEKITGEHPFDIPQSLIDNECRAIIREQIEAMKREGLPDEAIKDRRSSVEEGAVAQALMRLRIFYLVHALSESEGIYPSEQEIQKQMAPLLFHNYMAAQGGAAETDKKVLHDHAKYLALKSKVEDQLLKRVITQE